jgi:hypothetical protein
MIIPNDFVFILELCADANTIFFAQFNLYIYICKIDLGE